MLAAAVKIFGGLGVELHRLLATLRDADKLQKAGAKRVPRLVVFVDDLPEARGIWIVRNAFEHERRRLLRIIRIVSAEADSAGNYFGIEQDQPVIDRELRKQNHVDNRRSVRRDFRQQTPRGIVLMRATDRQNHPPVTAQNIRTPRAAALGFQNLFVRLTEIPKPGKSGKAHPSLRGTAFSRVAPDDLANPPRVVGFVEPRFVRSEFRVIKKLPDGPGQNKTAQRVVWFRLALGE